MLSVISKTLVEGVLPFCRDAVSVFYSLNRLCHQLFLNVKTVLFRTIQLSLHIFFCLHTVKCKTVLIQPIHFSVIIQFSFIRTKDRTLSGVTTPGQSELGRDGNEGVWRILQSSCITWVSPSDCLASYPGHSLGGGGLLLCRDAVGVFYNPQSTVTRMRHKVNF